MAETDRFLTLAELCTYLGVSKSFAYKLSHRNAIPKYCPTGGKIWFKKSDIDQWLNGHRIMSEKELNHLSN
ncbi:DNA binding domain-containing protein, excisionase family [Mucilaginibacter gossypiicola]|uniref:DNA binding domain-containing protein, excisionase family n=1 Tax=Mucilaginibacter gossypiicola TaxID=551995 RepID=A0A1H8UZB0_9SPHI|nr:helix-turn-helix domain-containing protein [Mucilaginibacter gossypiicola]SEP08505.1 DNA binding domain-containing protein, excisionase family [Mucilaginibacter gossypiicola]